MPLDEDQAQSTANLFKVLADPVRLRLLSLVASQPSREVCACDLVDVLGRSQPTISHHLKVLHEAGLLTRERRGTWIHYGLPDDAANDVAHATHIVFTAAASV
jgi:ArsR family transcriptional regulator